MDFSGLHQYSCVRHSESFFLYLENVFYTPESYESVLVNHLKLKPHVEKPLHHIPEEESLQSGACSDGA